MEDLIGDTFNLVGKSPFLINRLIVEIEMPSNSKTCLKLKKDDFVCSYAGDLKFKREIN